MNIKFFLLLLLILLVSGLAFPSSSISSQDWPVWRGGRDANKTHASAALENARGLKAVWRQAIGSGYSAVVVAKSKVVSMASDHTKDYVICLDENTGSELWRTPLAETYRGRDGASDGPVSTPAISDDAVFALGPFGDLVALDLETGARRWSTHLLTEHSSTLPHWGFTTSPLVYEDKVVVATGGSNRNLVTAFDIALGDIVWEAGDDKINYQSPLVTNFSGADQIICAGDERLYGLAPHDGAILWQIPHAGERFYAKILNPVVVGEDKLFMTYRGFESKLIQIRREQRGYQIDDVWTSRHLKRNYNIAVYHQGYLFGFSGDFLACIDATSGELIWKSRPPGNGFLVLVDGHLLVMTKKGSLHIVKASPEGYEEVADMQVFEKRVWTPPSFANGHIYVRNEFDAMAKIAVVKDDAQAVREHTAEMSLTIQGTQFSEFVSEAMKASDKAKKLNQFMRQQKRFPIMEGDSLVHLVFRGEVRDIALRGDMFETGVQVPMRHIPETDFYYASFKLDPRSLVGYQFIEDFDAPGPDPRNPNRARSGVLAGEVSLIRMPKFADSPYLTEQIDRQKGQIDTLAFKAGPQTVGSLVWQGSRQLKVYLPTGYETGESSYPVLYVHYGDLALAAGKMKTILDNVIGETVAPHIVVFVPAASAYEYARSQRDVYARALANEIVPLIDAHYNTIADASSRAILGFDEGGFGALYVAFRHPGIFGHVAAQSALPIGEGEELLFSLINDERQSQVNFYIDWGKYDQRVVASKTDVARTGRFLMQHLRKAGYRVIGGETPHGAGFPGWRLQTDKILRTFFPMK